MENGDDILKLTGITKRFPGVLALSGVDFTLRRGEIHALMGENGAGKSTLIKVLTGVYRKDAGTIEYLGRPVEVRSPLHAQELGISTVYQEVNLVPSLSVAENLFLGRQPRRWGRIAWTALNREAEAILRRFELHVDVRRNLGTYSIAIQQMVAIARALELQAQVLILDEPTSSLNIEEVRRLFEQMRRLKREGHSIIFITHFLDQVFQISDRITVLRNGEYIGTWPAAGLTKAELIARLLGKELEKLSGIEQEREEAEAAEGGEGSLVRAVGLGRSGGVKPFDLRIRKGEVVGCAGLLGSGRTEIAKLLFGVDAADLGEVYLEGRRVRIANPRRAMRHGIGLSPEDRKAQGIIEDLSVRENIVLAFQVRRGWRRNLSLREQREIADRYIKALNIKTPSGEQAMRNLSGGNQQKVIIARWLASNPRFLIVDEPTRGIDVGAKTEIQKLILELSKGDMAVLFISSEIEEIERCSTKVLVLHDLQVIRTLHGREIDENTIMQAIAAQHSDESPEAGGADRQAEETRSE